MQIAEYLTLYAIVGGISDDKVLVKKTEDALSGGVTMLQLREKGLPADEVIRRARLILPICKKYGAPLIINDDYEAALLCGADGVHVGATDTPVAEIRNIVGKNFIIGATAKSVSAAQAAEKNGADYIGVGACFPSSTKSEAALISPENFKKVLSSVSIPAVAIGGITAANAEKLIGFGASGIAVSGAVFGARDAKSAARELLVAAIKIKEV